MPNEVPLDKYGRPVNYTIGPYLHPTRRLRRANGIKTPLSTLLEYQEVLNTIGEDLDAEAE